MTVHEMSSTEVCWDTGRVYCFEIERESGATGRRVYAIRLAEDTATEYDDGDPITLLGIMTYGPPASNTTGTIYTTNITDCTSMLGVTDVARFTNVVIAHEIGHSVTLQHCPRYDSPNCYLWRLPDDATAFTTEYASHHDQDYDLIYHHTDFENMQRQASGPTPFREYSSDGRIYTRCFEDVNADGVVDIIDLLLVASYISDSSGWEQYVADVNRDGFVNISDLERVAAAFGNADCPTE